ncbi:MAG: hypothetical protein INR73_15595 [Williamsia sp.]|nr:hypothetical protein [Williamsia sp.]
MRLILIALLFALPVFTFSQSLTGSWYGKAQVLTGGSNNDYLTELIVKQKGDEIEGILGYYFRNGYKSVFIRGTYNKTRREITVKNIPITYYMASSIDGVDCTMDFAGVLNISKVQSRLNGSFVTIPRYRYTCPEIRALYTLDRSEYNQDSLIRNSIARKLWEPTKEDLVIAPAEPVINKPATDTAAYAPAPDKALEESFKKRTNVVNKEIEISSDSVRISFYDNGDIDGDSISVFVNNRPVLTKQSLTAQALNIYLKLDSTKAVNEISMFAENLGIYPPNTALMVVNDGEHRYEIYLSSNLSQNAVVRLRRKPKP